MSEGIIIAIISGVLSFAGVVLTVIYGNKKTQKSLKEQTDLTLYRIEQLEKKQDKHNSIIERTYKLEEEMLLIQEKQKVANHRISDLEHTAIP